MRGECLAKVRMGVALSPARSPDRCRLERQSAPSRRVVGQEGDRGPRTFSRPRRRRTMWSSPPRCQRRRGPSACARAPSRSGRRAEGRWRRMSAVGRGRDRPLCSAAPRSAISVRRRCHAPADRSAARRPPRTPAGRFAGCAGQRAAPVTSAAQQRRLNRHHADRRASRPVVAPVPELETMIGRPRRAPHRRAAAAPSLGQRATPRGAVGSIGDGWPAIPPGLGRTIAAAPAQ